MMLVKTRLKPSPIEGLGLFADEDIEKGRQIWKFWPGLDQLVHPDAINSLPEPLRGFCSRYAYLHTRTGMYVVCADDARYMNHSDFPNTGGVYPPGEPEGHDVALRDIRRGEELTCDYSLFDAELALKMSLAEPVK